MMQKLTYKGVYGVYLSHSTGTGMHRYMHPIYTGSHTAGDFIASRLLIVATPTSRPAHVRSNAGDVLNDETLCLF
jgi:nitrogen regulatory protein PII